MGHEISQYDISDRQLLASKTQSRVGKGKDIGEAKITHTIFGRAKVRVIREQDKKRRAWLLTGLAVTVLAAAAWQGWIATNRITPPPLSARIQVGAPAFQPGFLSPSTTPSARSKPGASSQTEINNQVASRKNAPQQPPGLNVAGQIAAKPVTAQPLTAGKPQTASLATNNNPSKNQTGMQQIPKLSAPIQPATAIVRIPIATQPAASSAAAAAPLAEPLVKEVTSTPSPTGINLPSSPVNAQSN